MQVQEGSLPRPHSNEIVLLAAIAANRNLHVGDVIGGDIGNDNAGVIDDMPTEMVVSGILSPGHPLIGFASYEYLSTAELSSSRNPHLLVIPHKGQKQVLDNWLETNIESTQTRIITYTQKEREHKEATTFIVLTFAALECMIAAVAAIALATLNYISYTQRREEYGILNAIGHGSRQLIWRTMKETISVIGVAWAVGAILCGIGLFLMLRLVYAPRGLPLNFFNPSPWLFTLPIPLAVIAVSTSVIVRTLSRLDPVSIIERR